MLGEFGSGRSSLLKQAMVAVAVDRQVPPDLCYLHNFDAPEGPLQLAAAAGIPMLAVVPTQIPLANILKWFLGKIL